MPSPARQDNDDNDEGDSDDSEFSSHPSQVDAREHPMFPICEEIDTTSQTKIVPITQRTSYIGAIAKAELQIKEEKKLKSGKAKLVIFGDRSDKPKARIASQGIMMDGVDLGSMSDEAVMKLYAQLDPAKKRDVLRALLREAKEVDETEQDKREASMIGKLIPGNAPRIATLEKTYDIK